MEVPFRNTGRSATREHLTPKARGGMGADNIVLACLKCNDTKSDMTLIEFQFFRANGKYPQSYIEYLEQRSREKLYD